MAVPLLCGVRRSHPLLSLPCFIVLCAVACVVHMTPGPIARNPEYVSWMSGFGGDVTHVLAAEPAAPGAPVMRASATLQAKLNALAPTFFPLQSAEAVTAASGSSADLPPGCVAGANMLRFQLRPLAKRGLDSEDVSVPLDVGEVQLQLQQEKPEVVKAAEAAAQGQRGGSAETVPACVADAGREELEVTFLGTGAAIPSKYRNVTGVLANLFARGALLMDCGERACEESVCLMCSAAPLWRPSYLAPAAECQVRIATQARAAMASYGGDTERLAPTTWCGA